VFRYLYCTLSFHKTWNLGINGEHLWVYSHENNYWFIGFGCIGYIDSVSIMIPSTEWLHTEQWGTEWSEVLQSQHRVWQALQWSHFWFAHPCACADMLSMKPGFKLNSSLLNIKSKCAWNILVCTRNFNCLKNWNVSFIEFL